MYGEREWREVRRLRATGRSQAEIARLLNMSRTTVRRLLHRDEPPRYIRRREPALANPGRLDVQWPYVSRAAIMRRTG